MEKFQEQIIIAYAFAQPDQGVYSTNFSTYFSWK